MCDYLLNSVNVIESIRLQSQSRKRWLKLRLCLDIRTVNLVCEGFTKKHLINLQRSIILLQHQQVRQMNSLSRKPGREFLINSTYVERRNVLLQLKVHHYTTSYFQAFQSLLLLWLTTVFTYKSRAESKICYCSHILMEHVVLGSWQYLLHQSQRAHVVHDTSEKKPFKSSLLALFFVLLKSV